MEQVLELRCQLEQDAIIKEIMFGGMLALGIQIMFSLIFLSNYD